jgi:hypothetical protein
MTYYSGTSDKHYKTECELDRCFSSKKPREISCFEDFNLARGFAYKRAKQINSIGIVIEITKESDFEIIYDGYPILIGKLKPKNHKIHILEDINFTN